MPKRMLIFVLSVLWISGCAAAHKNHGLDLQECQNRVSFLEVELKGRDREFADLEYELSRQKSVSYGKGGAVRKSNGGSAAVSSPSPVQIQRALKSAGYYQGPIDGKIGAKTQEAIVKFQKDNRLKADGKIGPMTWSELRHYLE